MVSSASYIKIKNFKTNTITHESRLHVDDWQGVWDFKILSPQCALEPEVSPALMDILQVILHLRPHHRIGDDV